MGVLSQRFRQLLPRRLLEDGGRGELPAAVPSSHPLVLCAYKPMVYTDTSCSWTPCHDPIACHIAHLPD